MLRRIVTDGTIFRIQHRSNDQQPWNFYDSSFLSFDDAFAELSRLNARNRAEDPERWREATTSEVPQRAKEEFEKRAEFRTTDVKDDQ